MLTLESQPLLVIFYISVGEYKKESWKSIKRNPNKITKHPSNSLGFLITSEPKETKESPLTSPSNSFNQPQDILL